MTKPIVALFKTYRGGEWFHLSLESIKNYTVGAVVVSSEKPWKGLPGTEDRQILDLPENCRNPLAKFKRENPKFRVHEVRLSDRHNSDHQYRIGLDAIKSVFGQVGVLIIDTDEIWDVKDLDALVSAMSSNNSLYFRSGIYTYVRSPLWRVHPQETGKVVVGLASPNAPIGDSRFSGVTKNGKQYIVEGCNYHHMGYVRLDHEEIITKLSNSCSQDGVKYRQDWKQEVWDKLPEGRDIHPATPWEKYWPGIEEVALGDLPRTLTSSDEFWAMAGYHKDGIPEHTLLRGSQSWRSEAEKPDSRLSTVVPTEYTPAFFAAMRQGRLTQEQCKFLVPRLRMSFKETCQLAKHASEVPVGGTILEIGSGLGGSMAVMGVHSDESVRLVAVDPYTPYDEMNKTLSRNLEVGTPDSFFQTIGGCGVGVVKLIQQTSMIAERAWHTKSDAPGLDLILVDGNHSYEHAIQDLSCWWRSLKPGGIILLHDLSGRFPGVVRAAREFESWTGLTFNLPYYSSLAWMKKPT